MVWPPPPTLTIDIMVGYTPLNADHNEIRLLHLHSGEPDDPLVCSLDTVSLDENVVYEAVSYVWGDPEGERRSITVDGKEHNVTVNLYNALRAFRDDHCGHGGSSIVWWLTKKRNNAPRALWVDALCINQDDIDERNQQVARMGTIYSSAKNVLVYLGPATAKTDLTMSWLRAFGGKRRVFGLPTSLPEAALWLWRALSDRLLGSNYYVRSGEGMADLVARPYWYRLWTYQEFVLGENDPVWHVGSTCASPDISCFETEPEALYYDPFDSEGLMTPGNTLLGQGAYAPGVERIGHRLGMSPFHMATLGRLMMNRHRQGGHSTTDNSPSPDNVFVHLFFAYGRRASNAHDAIYALYGLSPKLAAALPPDTRKPVRSVMWETAAYIIRSEKGDASDLFSYLPFADRLSVLPSICPSWVPDHSRALTPAEHQRYDNSRLPFSHIHDDLQSFGSAGSKASLSSDATTLHLWARPLAGVRGAAGQPSRIDRVWVLQGGREAAWRTVDDLLNHRTPVVANQRRGHPLLELLINLTTFDVTPLPENPFGSGMAFDLKLFNFWVKVNTQQFEDCTLFSTEGGYVGCGPLDARVGDVVVVPPESFMPITLRPETACPPAARFGTPEKAYYRYVGTAYVDGLTQLMHAGKSLVAEVAAQPCEEFLIR